MAQRYALLIGISRYGEGLQAIPSALKDVERMAEVLRDPDLGGIPEPNLQVLRNPGRTELATAIESFYLDKEANDLLLLYFSGHGFRDDDRQLLLSSAESKRVQPEGKVRVPRATTLTASEVRGFMERSRCKRQVVILDCCFSGAFAEGLMAKDEGAMEIEGMLGGKGRAILTSSDAIETSRAPEAGDGLSVYTRFLVEGIQTGAADRKARGWLDPEDLHHYSKSRVQEVAPTMTPQFFPTREGHSIRVCRVRRDPSVAYRQKLQELAEARGGKLSLVGREILAELQGELGLSAETAGQIEAEVLQPFRDYDAKLARYTAAAKATLEAAGNPATRLSSQDREELKELEQRLKLRASDVLAILSKLGITEEEREADQIPKITKGWLVRQGNQWRKQEELITVTGYREELADGVAITMIHLPGGEFLMGSPKREAERSAGEGPQHRVQLPLFFMGQTPITQAQWREVAQWQPKEAERWGRELKPNPSYFQHPGKARLLNNEASTVARPVECVSWDDAVEFCSRLSQRTGRRYTLPSEAQWEYACRAGTTMPFAFGETITTELANYDGTYTYGQGPKGEYRKQTTPVGMFPANAWGLQDMHGNVWEWCLDHWHESYEGAPEDGNARLSEEGEHRLLRGGSWLGSPRNCRSAYRNHSRPDLAYGYVGFRVVCLPQGPSLNP